MSDIIQLLPDSVANQIAAGEVIQRPASVVKELVENAVDAGAKCIHVLIEDAGRTSIQVIDDGKGMSETDARLSFERHSTSKIRKAEDLFTLHTMGFRGEALASIAAVAQIELLTRQANEEVGTRLNISGSAFQGQEPCSCPVGSNFRVSNLFYNVPARRKFLKSNTTEMNNILCAFERVALVYPDIMFTLHSNGTELLHLPADNLMKRIVGIFGKKLSQDLLPVNVETAMCKLTGFVGKPEAARKKCPHQYFFVNGRFMKHPYFHKAVMSAFDRLVPLGEQVPYFLYFEVPAQDVDVNIHPTKTEIKFENEQAIWQILSAAVKETLGRFNIVPSIDFDTEDKPDIPVFDTGGEPVDQPRLHYDASYNPFKSVSAGGGGAGGGYSRKQVEWEGLYSGLSKASRMNEPPVAPTATSEPVGTLFASGGADDIASSSSMFPSALSGGGKGAQHLQLKGRFILTSVKSGLMLIDQRRAHICVLYERYMEQIRQKQNTSQGLLFPEMVQLPPSEAQMLETLMDDFSAVGFDLASLGGGSYAINGVPSGIEGLDPVRLVTDMVHDALEKGSDVKSEVQSVLALSLAQSAAIVYGQVLTNEEMADLVDKLFACPAPNYTPDGRIVLATIKEEDIERLFNG